MIVSASRRTDIPAFYSEWFFNRIRDGYLYIRNPHNYHQVSFINLSPTVVDCIVFWTKNPEKMLAKLNLIDKYKYYFQYTITGYGQKLEPHLPLLEENIKIFKKLSTIIGPQRIMWRYDPILLSSELDIFYHINMFNFIATKLAGFTHKCVISFIDLYIKILKNIQIFEIKKISNNDMIEIATHINKIAHKYNLKVVSCAEKINLNKYGIEHGKCIDDKLIEEITQYPLNINKDENQRKECGCIASIDIGAYNTCPNGCLYCYANCNSTAVKKNFIKHNPNSPLLNGEIKSTDKIIQKEMISCRQIQEQLFNKNFK